MTVLQLLQDGTCPQQNTCLQRADDVHATCPQSFKCGTCVAWTPREKNRYTRNSGQCLLDRSSTQYLDCNAPICPYYRPRAQSEAATEWKAKAKTQQVHRAREVRTRIGKMTREAPPPSPEALAHAAFGDHDEDTAQLGAAVLTALLTGDALPALLERFRGGTAKVSGKMAAREVPLEALWARLVLVRRALDRLDRTVRDSGLDADVKAKIEKDLAGMAGSMTTFNVLFAKRDDAFRGSGG